MSWRAYRWVPVLSLGAFFAFSGCDPVPSIPSINQVQTVPDSSQTVVLAQNQFQPPSGPVGTILTIYGQGTVFPAGLVHFQFTGNGQVDFELNSATSQLQVQIPVGTISGPFGFTIAARSTQLLQNALPSSDLFQAWNFQAPGFLVTVPAPTTPLVSPPNEHQPGN